MQRSQSPHSRPFMSREILALALSAPLAFGACDTAGSASGDVVIATRAALVVNGDISNPSGTHASISSTGVIDQSNPFFQNLGTNGRTCASCHDPADGWSITPAHLQQRFNASGGTDPVFRLNDGANSPNAPVGTLAQRQAAYTQLLQRGLIRVGIPLSSSAEFTLSLVEDPYGFASANELSLYRRPLPSTNLKFLSAVMWDGRETVPGNTMEQNLMKQANDATMGHAQAATPPSSDVQKAIADFQLALFTTQTSDSVAGSLSANGGKLSPTLLSQQSFYIGINDPLGGNPTGTPFTSKAFTLYDSWLTKTGSAQADRQASIARGQNIFNTRVFQVIGVRGLNDTLNQSAVNATCTTCHDTPNVGNHSVSLPLDLGLTDPNTFNTDVMPRYTLTNKTTGAVIRTSDPGRAMITGKWADIGKFKGPILHSLAARPPYFHNGFAATLTDVVKFYDTRFHIGLDTTATADLVAFLQSL